MADFQTTPLWQLGQPHTIKASEIQQQITMDKPQDQENAKEKTKSIQPSKEIEKNGQTTATFKKHAKEK